VGLQGGPGEAGLMDEVRCGAVRCGAGRGGAGRGPVQGG
jgi:hypothetical protein